MATKLIGTNLHNTLSAQGHWQN